LNDYKKSEVDMLKERIKKEKDPEQQEHMKGLLLKMVKKKKRKHIPFFNN
jgi:ribosomal RNA-processing protein 36